MGKAINLLFSLTIFWFFGNFTLNNKYLTLQEEHREFSGFFESRKFADSKGSHVTKHVTKLNL